MDLPNRRTRSLAPGHSLLLPEWDDRENTLGKKAAIGPLKVGPQAHQIPTLASTVVQMVDLRVPNVVSLAFDAGFKSDIRTIDVTTTLNRYLSQLVPDALTTKLQLTSPPAGKVPLTRSFVDGACEVY